MPGRAGDEKVASALSIWLGVRRGWAETVNTGIVFFVIFLYTKFYQWWCEIMPKYLFFLVVGLSTVLILLILKRLRQGFVRRHVFRHRLRVGTHLHAASL